jgi:hypothetical protein
MVAIRLLLEALGAVIFASADERFATDNLLDNLFKTAVRLKRCSLFWNAAGAGFGTTTRCCFLAASYPDLVCTRTLPISPRCAA